MQGPDRYEEIIHDDPDNVWVKLGVSAASIYDFSSYPSNITNALNDVRSNPFLVPSLDIRKMQFDAWEKFTVIINGSALYFLLCKIVFNICKKKNRTLPINYDVWTQIDICSALFSIMTFRLISMTSVEDFDPEGSWHKIIKYLVTA